MRVYLSGYDPLHLLEPTYVDLLGSGYIILWWYSRLCVSLLTLQIPSPHLPVLATSKQFLSAGGIFRAILATESHWLQPVLVLFVHWWPGPAGVGRVKVYLCFWTCSWKGWIAWISLHLFIMLSSILMISNRSLTKHDDYLILLLYWCVFLFLLVLILCGT